ncbi:MAG: ABC transporter permease [Bacteroidales bacterium]|nr:ABC transporter permease [Bacteroidales bacterium]MBN2758265.1 ABC transporter permease [Bacteroidales bacterium]
MRTIIFILEKEFKQIFRNKIMIPIIFVVPFVQLLILVHAATFEIKNIDLLVVDNDFSSTSRQIISKFKGSPFFNLVESEFSVKKAEESLYNDKADVVLVIPSGFEKKLIKENKSDLQLLVNAINGVVAGLSNYYASAIIMSVNKDLIVEMYGVSKNSSSFKQINIEYSHWYNPQLNYKTYMVPGILVLLVTIIGLYLSGMNLVREKEVGTIEQINVTPIKKYQFIIGKLVPFWIIAMFELAFGLVLGKLLFDIPIIGNLFLVFGVAAIYLLVILGIGLFISTITENQLQAMFFAFFFTLIFILMSGLFTSVESMPKWGQFINKINPIAYFIKVMRMILLKGSGFKDIIPEISALLFYAFSILGLAIWRYRKTT